MTLYTLISEWQGGSTVLQVQAPDPRKAVEEWAQDPAIEEVAPYVEIPLAEIRKNIPEMKIQKQADLQNIWQGELLMKEGLLLLQIVGTLEE
jgi:hypothetical protein